jgi:hypothetical protein
LLALEIDHRVHYVMPLAERTAEPTHIRRGILWVEARDENGRAQGLGEA